MPTREKAPPALLAARRSAAAEAAQPLNGLAFPLITPDDDLETLAMRFSATRALLRAHTAPECAHILATLVAYLAGPARRPGSPTRRRRSPWTCPWVSPNPSSR